MRKTRFLIGALTGALLIPAPLLAQDHSVHDMSGHDMSSHAMDHSQHDEGMAMPSHEAHDSHDAHQGHAMPMAPGAPSMAQDIPQGPPPPEAFSGPEHAADAYFPGEDMAHARHMVRHEMGGMGTTIVMLDRLEAKLGKGSDGLSWEGALRTGGDIDRLWIKSEGEAAFGEGIEDAEVEVLWGHAIGAWFDLQAGVRQELGPDPDRTQVSLGVEGLAPYMFDISAQAFLSTKGELTARLEAETDQRLTQRLILQPRAEALFSAQRIAERGTGRGLTSLEAGVRLRYEFARQFAPYVGVEWQKKFGSTADYARAVGDDPDRVVAVAGLRAWF
ncbi:copper resistance protein B [Novosphingobium decolorationis]|uniref:Copper resistance protein B n=1 Tax=Novosphingobium decolorationis TaxID=2698673 RepID=A0ABX8E7P6_9SPHN|nr:copper resistance protein B [Novosphingobium decolorationis]QVM85197.1 copper resistance protein B [Novosphingobium decolorationis]